MYLGKTLRSAWVETSRKRRQPGQKPRGTFEGEGTSKAKARVRNNAACPRKQREANRRLSGKGGQQQAAAAESCRVLEVM